MIEGRSGTLSFNSERNASGSSCSCRGVHDVWWPSAAPLNLYIGTRFMGDVAKYGVRQLGCSSRNLRQSEDLPMHT